MAGHAPYSPSAGARWTACTASVPLTEAARALGLTDESSSPYAREGTVAMKILEYLVASWNASARCYAAAPRDAAAEAVAEGDIDFTEIAPDMLGAITFAARHLEDLLRHSDQWGIEDPVYIPQVPTRGTPDFWCLLLTNVLVVVDYKHGAGVSVEAENNWQLTLYAAGLAERLGLARDRPVLLQVLQPRCEEGRFKQWQTTVGHVIDRAEEAGARINSPPEFRVGPHCQWCPATLLCGKRHAELQEVADLPDPGQAANDIVARALNLDKRVSDVVKAARNVAIARLQAGKEVPGWTLAEGRGAFVWKEGALKALSDKFGEAAYSKPQPLSPAQVRDNLSDGAEFFRAWTFRTPGAPTLKPGSSKPREINWPAGAANGTD